MNNRALCLPEALPNRGGGRYEGGANAAVKTGRRRITPIRAQAISIRAAQSRADRRFGTILCSLASP